MAAKTSNYAEVLYDLGISGESIQTTRQTLQAVGELTKSLENPTVSFEAKCRIIDRVFPAEMRNYMKVIVSHHMIERMENIFADYEELCRKKANVIRAVLCCVTAPDEKQLDGIRSFLCKEFKADRAEVILKEDPSLIGGFVLRAGGKEYDWSLKGRFCKLEQQLTTRR